MSDQLSQYNNIWIDGEIVPSYDAKISIMSHALHYASSVFEGIRAYDSHVFKLNQHLNRLEASAQLLGFTVPYTKDILKQAIYSLMEAQQHKEAYIRIIVWCGIDKITVSHSNIDVHAAIAIWERAPNYQEKHFTEGIRLCIADWKRPAPDTAPTQSKAAGLYMISSLSKVQAEKSGYDDALMLDYRGYIAEASSSNIFLVIDNALYTPIPDCFLNGITRLTVIELAHKLGIPIAEAHLSIDALDRAQEVFLTGTAIEILPVGRIEGAQGKWSFKPGLITHTICNAFADITRNNGNLLSS